VLIVTDGGSPKWYELNVYASRLMGVNGGADIREMERSWGG